jgi:hypothetical protein
MRSILSAGSSFVASRRASPDTSAIDILGVQVERSLYAFGEFVASLCDVD